MTKGEHKRDKRLSMRISSPLLLRLQKRAKADRRSVADWTLLLLEAELDRLDKLGSNSKSQLHGGAADPAPERALSDLPREVSYFTEPGRLHAALSNR